MKEMRRAFDENCCPTEKHYYSDECCPQGYYPMAVMIAIKNSKGQFLMQKRSRLKSSPLTWAVTGGHPAVNETNLQGIIREVKEEIGIDIKNNKIESFYLGFDGRVCREMFYCEVNGDVSGFTLQPEEVEEVAWFSEDEIVDMMRNKELSQNQIYFYEKLFSWEVTHV